MEPIDFNLTIESTIQGGFILIFRSNTPEALIYIRKICSLFDQITIPTTVEGCTALEFIKNPFLPDAESFENWLKASMYPMMPTGTFKKI